MKNLLYLLPLCLVVLGRCASAPVDTTPVWQQQLPETGVEMEVSNCTLLGEEPVYYTLDRDSADPWVERPALQTEGVPVVTLRGVEPEQVDALAITPGEDYCTLVTCTPYGINTHRLLVRGRRVENAREKAHVYVPADMVQIDPLVVTPAVAAPMLAILLVFLLVRYRKRR